MPRANKANVVSGYKFRNIRKEEIVVLYEINDEVVVVTFLDQPYKQAMLKCNCYDGYVVYNGNKTLPCTWQSYMNEKWCVVPD